MMKNEMLNYVKIKYLWKSAFDIYVVHKNAIYTLDIYLGIIR